MRPVNVSCFCELKPHRRESALDRQLSFERPTRCSAQALWTQYRRTDKLSGRSMIGMPSPSKVRANRGLF